MSLTLDIPRERLMEIAAEKKRGRKLFNEYAELHNYTTGAEGVYSWQAEFHNAGATMTERLLMAGNRCITPWTVVETVPRSLPIVQLLGEKNFCVRSWGDELRRDAIASGVFLKGIESAFHVLLDNGKAFQCSGRHRVLTTDGWLALAQLVQRASGLRWSQTIEDYQASYAWGVRQCGRSLRWVGGNDQQAPPSEGDVQTSARLVFSLQDVAEHISRCSHAYLPLDQKASLDDHRLIVDLCGQFPDPTAGIDALLRFELPQTVAQWPLVSGQRQSVTELRRRSVFAPWFSVGGNASRAAGNRLEPSNGKSLGGRQSLSSFDVGEACLGSAFDVGRAEIFFPKDHPSLVGGCRIMAVADIGLQPIVDFTVAETRCYWAGGVLHHNTGKSRTGAAEVAIHATGLYPKWWRGRKYTRPVEIWCGSENTEASRDIVQKALLGNLGEYGTGMIPKQCLVDTKNRQAGVTEVVETITVRHVTGRNSRIGLKTYEQGRKAWQGASIDVIWDDELVPMEIYTEGLTRLLDRRGIMIATFTPMEGASAVVQHFMEAKPNTGIYVKNVTWEDAPHIDPVERERLWNSYPAFERDARAKGTPMLGTGAVFPINPDEITVTPFPLPDHFYYINGIDFGIDHPAAGAFLAWDKDSDTIYMYDCYKRAGETAIYHANAMKKHGEWIPTSWPHDGMERDKGSGEALKNQYRRHGLYMLKDFAQYSDGRGHNVEPGLQEMFEYMRLGKFKVFSTCQSFFEEQRLYHRKDGQIVRKNDDVISATRYAFMMRRFARHKPRGTAQVVAFTGPALGSQRWKGRN